MDHPVQFVGESILFCTWLCAPVLLFQKKKTSKDSSSYRDFELHFSTLNYLNYISLSLIQWSVNKKTPIWINSEIAFIFLIVLNLNIKSC